MNHDAARPPAPAAPRAGELLARGVVRGLIDLGFGCLTEVPTRDGRRMDVLALGKKGELWCVEVKSSRADFLSDSKWPHYLDWCDRLFFAVPEDFPEDLLPWEHGLIRTDGWGCAMMRAGTEKKLSAIRRKAVTLSFARLAAERLARQSGNAPDPERMLA